MLKIRDDSGLCLKMLLWWWYEKFEMFFFIFAPRSSSPQPMDQALFKIREKGKFGFINRQGEVVIEPQYYEAEEIGRAHV